MGMSVPLRRLGYRLAYRLLLIYWFVCKPHTHGVKCVIREGDRVLLVHHSYGPREWELPGGAVRRGEPPLTTARREIREELGVQIDDWVALGELERALYRRRDTLHCFQAELRGRALELDPVEIARASWFEPDSLPKALGRSVAEIVGRARG
jgi:8-oxo-dGTP pyrophosphatase MutT (NUDIX family)